MATGATLRKKHEPKRRCVSCGERDGKRALLRIVRNPESAVAVDQTGKASGRGAYICGIDCIETAVAKGRIEHALRIRLTPNQRSVLVNALLSHFG